MKAKSFTSVEQRQLGIQFHGAMVKLALAPADATVDLLDALSVMFGVIDDLGLPDNPDALRPVLESAKLWHHPREEIRRAVRTLWSTVRQPTWEEPDDAPDHLSR